MSFFRHTLANGLTLIGEQSASARSVSLGFFVRTGARDEVSAESGVSHFLEHMVFKGTQRRTALDVNLDFDRIGAQYNAFTSEENTVFYAAVLPEYLPRALDILADILRPSLRQDDFDMEKNVIIEEIGMYDDQPMWCTYERAKKAFFAEHPLANSVLGTADSIRALTRDQMQAYYDRRYAAPNITLAVAGAFDWSEVIAQAERCCGHWPTGEAPRVEIRPVPPRAAFEVVAKDKVVQEQVFLLAPGPATNAPLRYAAGLLAMVVGDDSGSRLYWELVDPGLTDAADMSHHDYDGAGAYFLSFSCEPDNTAANLAVVRRVLAEVQSDGITADELAVAKNKLLSRVVRSSERPRSRMQALGMTWTYLHEYRSIDDELRAYDLVTLQDVRALLDQFPLDTLATVALGPLTQLTPPA